MMFLVGYPCPTCGMTTAFAHTVRGEFRAAFAAQPGGLVLALATVLAASVSASVLATGRVWLVNWYRITPMRVTLATVFVVIGGWAYKLAMGVLTGALPAG